MSSVRLGRPPVRPPPPGTTPLGTQEVYKRSTIGYTDPSILLLFLFAYMMATIAFAFTVSACFNSGRFLFVSDPHAHHDTTQHNTSHHITSHHITSHHITSHHITSHHITSHHTTSRHDTTHHITTQHNTTQHNTTQHNTTQHNTT